MRNFVRISPGDEAGLKAAVAFQGPISVAVDGSHNMFRVTTIMLQIRYGIIFSDHSSTVEEY